MRHPEVVLCNCLRMCRVHLGLYFSAHTLNTMCLIFFFSDMAPDSRRKNEQDPEQAKVNKPEPEPMVVDEGIN